MIALGTKPERVIPAWRVLVTATYEPSDVFDGESYEYVVAPFWTEEAAERAAHDERKNHTQRSFDSNRSVHIDIQVTSDGI